MSSVAVVGGGLAGLCAARQLRAAGIDVTVFEASSRAGGVIQTSRANGYVREHAANGFLTSAENGAADLCDELGVALEPASPRAKRRFVYRGGRLRPVPSGPGDLLRAELISRRGVLTALAEPFRPAGRDSDESVTSFFRRRLGSEVADALATPLCTGIFAGDPDKLSARAAFPRLHAMEKRGGLLRSAASMIAERLRSRADKAGPARAPLMAPPAGMGQVVDALAIDLGDRLVTERAVIAIEPGESSCQLLMADNRRQEFDAVVLAVPAPVATMLVSDAMSELAGVLGQIELAPIAMAHLGYRSEDAAGCTDGFGFLVGPGEDVRVIGSVFESTVWPSRAPEGHALIRCMMGGARDPDIMLCSDDEIADTAHRDLERAKVVSGEPVHRHVIRWPHAIAQYTLGHLDRVGRAEALAEPRGVILAGASYHGVAVNACVADARRVAQRVAARLASAATLLLLVCLAACSSGTRPPGGAQLGADDGGSRSSATSRDDSSGAATGSIAVSVAWLDPPADVVSSAGLNPCGAPQRPAMDISALGGVANAFIAVADGEAEPAGDARDVRLVVSSCQVEPAAVVVPVGSRIVVENRDERRQEVMVRRIDPASGAAEPMARAPLALVGQSMVRTFEAPAHIELRPDSDPSAFALAYVSASPWVALTDEAGKARLDDVPAGRRTLTLWHPAADGGKPITRQIEVAVEPGKTADVDVSLAPSN